MRATRLCWLLAVLLLSTCGGMGVPGSAVAGDAPGFSPGLVFVIDGAGGFEAASRTIRETAAEERAPLEVRSYRWTHGHCRVVADQVHAAHLRREGKNLADLLLRCRQEVPGRPLYLIGHSAGCGLALEAAENLPPETLERVILMAPAVAAKHDLRPALAATCRGIDVFISHRDWACLSIGTFLAGTTDRCRTLAAAGKIGFQPILTSPADAALYAKLRQYPWSPSLASTGHKGGHYGSYQPGFLRAFVLPLLDPRAANPPADGWRK